MPSSNKTSLGFNNWQGAEKPKRTDFTADNALADSLLTAHFGDVQKHFSAQDREKFSSLIACDNYDGDGAAEKVISLPFAASAVFVFRTLAPLVAYDMDRDVHLVNAGAAANGDNSGGLYLSGSTLTVYQHTAFPNPGGLKANLNQLGAFYTWVAAR